jgi:hypothetical protein
MIQFQNKRNSKELVKGLPFYPRKHKETAKTAIPADKYPFPSISVEELIQAMKAKEGVPLSDKGGVFSTYKDCFGTINNAYLF